MVAAVPEQIVVVPEMVAVGNGRTVTVALPVWFCEQDGVPEEATLTKSYVVLAVKAPVFCVAVPAAFKTIVWLPPPLTV